MSEVCQVGPGLDRAVATRVMGWEFLELGYFGTADETPRMRELVGWLDEHDIVTVGEYFIDVPHDYHRDAADFNPSEDIHSAFEILAVAREWPFSKRRAFTTALADRCRVDAIPPEVGFDLVAWPDALIHFRHQMPEFICRAALEVQGGRR